MLFFVKASSYKKKPKQPCSKVPSGRRFVCARLPLFCFSYFIPWLYPSTSILSLLIPLSVDFPATRLSSSLNRHLFQSQTPPASLGLLRLNPSWRSFLNMTGARRNHIRNISQNPSAAVIKRSRPTSDWSDSGEILKILKAYTGLHHWVHIQTLFSDRGAN